MTYSLACGDVVPGCAATFDADTKDALMGEVAAHAGSEHGVTEISPEMAGAVEGAIKEK